MSFLPDDYKIPDAAGNYLKFKIGDNRFRILASPIIGYEYWTEGKEGRKPVRVRPTESVPSEYGEFAKHFWAMPVWNYDENRLQILEITQKSIMKALAALTRNAKWGTPLGYDVCVTRTGEGMDTEYALTPEPKEELDKTIAEAFKKANINLEALYDSGDPFQATETNSKGELTPKEDMDKLAEEIGF